MADRFRIDVETKMYGTTSKVRIKHPDFDDEIELDVLDAVILGRMLCALIPAPQPIVFYNEPIPPLNNPMHDLKIGPILGPSNVSF